MPATKTTAAAPPVKKSRTIITPEATAIFVYVWEPRESINEGQPPQYAISLAFKKTQDLSELRKAVNQAAKDKFADKGAKFTEGTFRNIDDMETPLAGFRGGIFITAKSKTKPGIVDKILEPIVDPMDFYPGCICKASIVPFAYDKKGSKGVTFLLNNIQKVKDGVRLDGKKKAEDEFSAIEDEEDPF